MAGCAGEAASIGLAPGAGGQAGDFATDIWEGYAVTDLSTELARLAEAATAGPWEATKDVRKPYKRLYSCPAIYSEQGMVAETLAGLPGEENNAALIVALRNAVPELLSALRAQQHAEAMADALRDIADNGYPSAVASAIASKALAAYRSVKP